MHTNCQPEETSTIKTTCGKVFGHTFSAIKFVRDEQYNFHVVYKTFSGEYIYSSCNPFQDTFPEQAYKLISEEEAKAIFLNCLSQDNARELFTTAPAPALRILS
jgi:hypothetical protein